MNRNNTGAALIIVLFISAILGAVSALLIMKTRQHVERLEIAKQFLVAERTVVSDLSHFIFSFQTSAYAIIGDQTMSDKLPQGFPVNSNLYGEAFQFRDTEFEVQDMGGLIPLIPTDRNNIRKFLEKNGWPAEEIVKFLDVLEDWQDNDSFQRLSGAEASQYAIFGYPFNAPLQTVKDVGLLARVAPSLLQQLANNSDVILYTALRTSPTYAPNHLLDQFNTAYDAERLAQLRERNNQSGRRTLSSSFTSGSFIIKARTSYSRAKSSRILHLVRRPGDHRPFVISRWRER